MTADKLLLHFITATLLNTTHPAIFQHLASFFISIHLMETHLLLLLFFLFKHSKDRLHRPGWWETGRQGGKNTPWTALCHCLVIYPAPSNTSHSLPPERDHRHIIAFKSWRRARRSAGGGEISHENQWPNTEIMSPNSDFSVERWALAADPRTARGVFSVTRLNWFTFDLQKWIFTALPGII